MNTGQVQVYLFCMYLLPLYIPGQIGTKAYMPKGSSLFLEVMGRTLHCLHVDTQNTGLKKELAVTIHKSLISLRLNKRDVLHVGDATHLSSP